MPREPSSGRRLPIDKKLLQATTKFGTLGIFFGVAIAIGFFGGRWLDRRWHTEPYLSLLGLLIGVAAGFRELYRVSKQYVDEQRRK